MDQKLLNELINLCGASKPPGFIWMRNVFAAAGADVHRVEGACWFSGTAVAINHDGVQYMLDIHAQDKKRRGEKIDEAHLTLQRFRFVSKHYHPIIKALVDHAQEHHEKRLWVLVGGGLQLQAFIGNEHGYIGILYLDLHPEAWARAEKGKPVLRKSGYTLVLEGKDKKKFFSGFSFEQPKIRIKNFGE